MAESSECPKWPSLLLGPLDIAVLHSFCRVFSCALNPPKSQNKHVDITPKAALPFCSGRGETEQPLPSDPGNQPGPSELTDLASAAARSASPLLNPPHKAKP